MKRVLLYIGIALAAIGCTKENSTENTPLSGEISFYAGVTTRVTTDNDCVWESGDEIGIFTNQPDENNLLFTISNTTSGAMSNESGVFLEDDGRERSYYAYYPYLKESSDEDFDWDDQGYVLNFDYNHDNYPTLQSEFLLWATTTSKDTEVTLEFTHMFPKVTFNITAGGMDVTSLENATVSLRGANSAGTFGLKSGEFNITGTDDLELDMVISEDDETTGTIIAYLPPVEVDSGNVKLWITTKDGNIYIYSITTEKWESGNSYEYDITVGTSNPVD